MIKDSKTVVYDKELNLEAYRFTGTIQPFPNHFHEHYVIGLVEEGQRRLSCKNKEYVIEKGKIILFNPGTTMPACRAMREYLTIGALTYPGEPCLILRGKSVGRGNYRDFRIMLSMMMRHPAICVDCMRW